ncbi:thiol reductant ABC exporter subunit CydD [Luteimonas sp. RD2P54]|uniref:Thiol reductant ABC exporter subunit CydD n=1 Tax=Luteimonas endophytica TaxID=3042023 RepID=A0ABT6JA84_9GAMM|nr:thiol reductant ABC exporter subunit CydD [Luteimonas endophytica]MDH5823108.1 thiol reductant ABC exporter subunit CydD [Luteimonas endophytica]
MDQSLAAEPLPQPSDIRARRLRRLDALASPVRGRLRAAGACAVLAGWLLVAQAALIALAVQRVLVEGGDPAAQWPALTALAAIGAARALLGWGARELADEAATRIRSELRTVLPRRMFAAGVPWIRGQRSGGLSELAATHVDALEGYFTGYLPARAEVLAVPALMLAAAFSVDVVVGLVLLLTMPLIPFFMMLVGWGAEAASRRQLRALARMGGHFADRLRGLGLIRLYGRGEAELEGIGAAAEALRVRTLKVLRLAFLSSAVLEFFASVSVAVIALYLGLSYLGMIELRTAPLTLGTGLFCLLLAPEFFAPMRKLAAHYHDRAGALAALEEIDTALGAQAASSAASSSRFDGDGTAMADPQARGRPRSRGEHRAGPGMRANRADTGGRGLTPAVVLRGVALRHAGSDRDVLVGFDLDIPPGGSLALVGPSGCGKSTLLEALAGWLSPAAGTLRIEPAARIAYAPQRPHLFHGSIADNLRLAKPEAGDAELRAAAEAAQVMRFAAHLPAGLDTVIGERGFGLSGGEARRVALARVYLRDAGLLLLDEPTAFLDPDTEAALLEALASYARGRTLILATHSAAAARIADRSLVMPAAHEPPR